MSRFVKLHIEKKIDAEKILEELKGLPGVDTALLENVDARGAKYFLKVDESAVDELKKYGTPTVLEPIGYAQ